ncbi:MAG: ABC-2 transporter permease, partial [Syntrophomonadaceae bacterium]|nr:ABC-2 transporter permease [Syntrophomonadaceae bacterium]
VSMSMDETNHWDRIALTMPVSRRDMVLSKYVLCLLAVLLSGVLSVLCILYGTLGQAVLFDPRLFLMPGLIITAIILPLQFKFGVNNARLIFLALFFGWFFIGEPLLDRNGYSGIADLLNLGISMSLPGWCLIILAIMALSVLLSLKAYAKRQF